MQVHWLRLTSPVSRTCDDSHNCHNPRSATTRTCTGRGRSYAPARRRRRRQCRLPAPGRSHPPRPGAPVPRTAPHRAVTRSVPCAASPLTSGRHHSSLGGTHDQGLVPRRPPASRGGPSPAGARGPGHRSRARVGRPRRVALTLPVRRLRHHPRPIAVGATPRGPWKLGGWWRSARPRSTRPSSRCRIHDACRRQCDIGPASERTHGSRVLEPAVGGRYFASPSATPGNMPG
jgi:hypothetical protein